MNNDDENYHPVWRIVLQAYQDFLDGWYPSPDEPGIMLRMPPVGQKNSPPIPVRKTGAITLH
jgi:hypothetical protein